MHILLRSSSTSHPYEMSLIKRRREDSECEKGVLNEVENFLEKE